MFKYNNVGEIVQVLKYQINGEDKQAKILTVMYLRKTPAY